MQNRGEGHLESYMPQIRRLDVDGCSEHDEQDLEGGEEGGVSRAFHRDDYVLTISEDHWLHSKREKLWREDYGWAEVVYTNSAEDHCHSI